MKVYKYIKAGDNALTITAGNNLFVKVPVAPEGMLSKIVVRQRVGDTGTTIYAVDLFDTQLLPEGLHTTALPYNAELYRVFPTKNSIAGGEVVDYTTGESGYSYRNMDGTFSVPNRCLWLHIRPVPAAYTSHWEVAIVVNNEIG